ncbi:MAG: hypothetical protein WCC17_16770 [Candidatus Nitrosopolaris sp.]
MVRTLVFSDAYVSTTSSNVNSEELQKAISSVSTNTASSLAPAVLSGTLGNLWLYWSATFIATSTIVFLLRKKFNISKRLLTGSVRYNYYLR